MSSAVPVFGTVCEAPGQLMASPVVRLSVHASVYPSISFLHFYTPPHNSDGVLWFHVGRPCVRPSVHPSVHFSFPDDNSSKH